MSQLGPLMRSLATVAVLAQGCSGTLDLPSMDPSGDAPRGSHQLAPTAEEPPQSLPAKPVPRRLGAPEDAVIGGIFGGGWYDEIYTGVAVGSGFTVGGERIVTERGPVEAVIWTSDDGLSWVPATAANDGFREAQVGHLVTDGDVILAIGVERYAVDDEDEPIVRVIWRSEDGLVWERVEPVDREIANQGLSGVFGDADGFVAWGTTFFQTEDGFDTADRILLSEDGIDWTPVNTAAFDEAEIYDVARWNDGYVAVGNDTPSVCVEEDCTANTDGPARAWWSPDGMTWESADVELGEELKGVYPLAEGMLAIGDPSPPGVVPTRSYWHSDDGRSWSIVAEGQDFRTSVASDGERVILWDRIAPDFSNTGPGVMRASTDGISWQEIGTVDTGEMDSVGLIIGANGILVLLVVDGENQDAGVLFVPFA